jgi:hypothetical protein
LWRVPWRTYAAGRTSPDAWFVNLFFLNFTFSNHSYQALFGTPM